MWGSCHFDRALNDEISVKFWMFAFIFFQLTLQSDLKEVQLTQNYLFWVKAPLQYLEGALNFKTRPWLKNITITNIQNSTLNSPFDALSKWHDPDINKTNQLLLFLISEQHFIKSNAASNHNLWCEDSTISHKTSRRQAQISHISSINVKMRTLNFLINKQAVINELGWKKFHLVFLLSKSILYRVELFVY